MSFEEFYKKFGFDKYPFSAFTAENELGNIKDIFVQPSVYSPIKESIDSGSPAFIFGERGTGKTVLLKEITNNKKTIDIDNFSSIPIESSSEKIYDLFLTGITKNLLLDLSSKQIRKAFLTREEKILISYLIKYYANHTTLELAYEKIRAIQHHPIKVLAAKIYNPFRSLLNSIASSTIDIVSDTVLKHLNLPSTNNFEARDFFKELSLDKITDPAQSSENFHILEKTLALYKKINGQKAIFCLDKIDEDQRLENDADKISEFIKPLFTDNKFLLHEDIQIVVSVWSIPFNKILPYFRKNKFCCEEIKWDKNELEDLLDTRLSSFSENKVKTIKSIMANPDDFEKLWGISHGNPRDMLQALNCIFKAQHSSNKNAELLSERAVQIGIANFVKGFSFYEYYPRKSNARKNSMDIYSYISHLLKLDNPTFTANALSERAKTGSSTTNYIFGMESIGLIVRCEEKGPNGSTMYEIRDPKVLYALSEKIDIRRER
ncbi:P-loop ATPase, Sll1717 family [Pseudomonas hunanensis]|uniref:P-loop ATPase, Sll1717 family n=1 Tax=Pseudomonas hunanensis TaxID=1247546 RepID=UPI00240586F9|nr:hypothetical protein [Pseudomonas hunanensis]MDF9758202.1 Cdc6-like AAA superfamily ATPase [Pseudomonas hunanensis]